jgi:hypothetical protein
MPTFVTAVAIYSQTSEFSNTFRSKVVDDLRYKSLSGRTVRYSPETEPGTGEKCDIIGRLAGR